MSAKCFCVGSGAVSKRPRPSVFDRSAARLEQAPALPSPTRQPRPSNRIVTPSPALRPGSRAACFPSAPQPTSPTSRRPQQGPVSVPDPPRPRKSTARASSTKHHAPAGARRTKVPAHHHPPACLPPTPTPASRVSAFARRRALNPSHPTQTCRTLRHRPQHPPCFKTRGSSRRSGAAVLSHAVPTAAQRPSSPLNRSHGRLRARLWPAK